MQVCVSVFLSMCVHTRVKFTGQRRRLGRPLGPCSCPAQRRGSRVCVSRSAGPVRVGGVGSGVSPTGNTCSVSSVLGSWPAEGKPRPWRSLQADPELTWCFGLPGGPEGQRQTLWGREFLLFIYFLMFLMLIYF